jgi:uncharacterized protein YndB with AHSA1/START domain
LARVSELRLQQDFPVSAERLYDALADQEGMSAWMGSKITVRERGASGLVGTVRRIHLGPASFDERIVEAQRPSRIVYRICSPVPLLAHHRGELQIEALGERASRVTWRVELALRPSFVGAPVRAGLGLVLRVALERLARRLS